MEPVRLQKYLARCGLGSRRACERLIDEGRVELNGRIVTEPGMKVKGTDTVRVDDRNVSPVDLRYFIVNKPTGVISVDRDHKERVYVVDLVPGGRDMGLFPVGRLDLDTTGLMVLTNDGEMANLIAHPRYGVSKEYIALVKGNWKGNDLVEATSKGVRLDDGYLVRDITILRVITERSRTRVTLRIHEGKKHVVKRIFLSLGSRVYELHRSAIGGLRLGSLGEGEWRDISREEIFEKVPVKETYQFQ
ncbi:MAG: pseudouridine synthase [Thermoplasmatota archaeon]